MPDAQNRQTGGLTARRPLHLLFIGQDAQVALRLAECLAGNGVILHRAAGLAEARLLLSSPGTDFLFTDLNPSDTDGPSLCRALRELCPLPLMAVSTRQALVDRVLSLEMGADDFLAFPFEESELAARVKAVWRRYAGIAAATAPQQASPPAGKVLQYPGLTISLSDYSLFLNGQRTEMPPRELELLFFLASSPNQVFTREQLLDQVWGYEYVGDSRTVDVHVKRIRAKLKDTSDWNIATVWGVGYKFSEEQQG